MARSVTPGAISLILSNPTPESPSEVPEIVVQVVDLKSIGSSNNRFTFMASDGNMKLKALLPTVFASEVHSGNLQNLGLLSILHYTCNSIPNQPEKFLILTKCEVVSPPLELEIKSVVKREESEVVLKPKENVGKIAEQKSEAKKDESGTSKVKQDIVAKSAAQIVHEQRGK